MPYKSQNLIKMHTKVNFMDEHTKYNAIPMKKNMLIQYPDVILTNSYINNRVTLSLR